MTDVNLERLFVDALTRNTSSPAQLEREHVDVLTRNTDAPLHLERHHIEVLVRWPQLDTRRGWGILR